MQTTTYHDTFWDVDEEFSFPSISYSDLEAIFVSNGQPVAENFSSYHGGDPEDGSAFVIMRGATTCRNPFTYDPAIARTPWVEVSQHEDDYHIANDREELFEALRRSGYDACIIKDNYPEGDDIALFEDDAFDVKDYSISFDGKIWSEWMSFDDAVEYFEKGRVVQRDLVDDMGEGFSP